MSNRDVYTISTAQGTRLHFAFEPKSRWTLCGRENPDYRILTHPDSLDDPKFVEELGLYESLYCKRCVNAIFADFVREPSPVHSMDSDPRTADEEIGS